MLSRICGSKVQQLIGRCCRLHIKELRDLYFSQITGKRNKSRRMRGAWNVPGQGGKLNTRHVFKVRSGEPLKITHKR